jgi:hypothetical protein
MFFFRFCKSCNRPPLPTILVTLSLIFIGIIAVIMAYFTFTTVFSR